MHGVVAQPPPQQLGGPVGDHLVGIHVGRSARAGLEDVHHELGVELPVSHFLRRLLDGRSQALVQQAQLGVGGCRVLLDQAKRADERPGKAQSANREVLHGPRRLRAVIGVRRDAHLAHGISLNAKLPLHGAK